MTKATYAISSIYVIGKSYLSTLNIQVYEKHKLINTIHVDHLYLSLLCDYPV